MSRMKPSRRKKFEEYRDYMSNASMRERSFLKTLDLAYGVTTYVDRWLRDLDQNKALPVICYTSIIPPEDSLEMFKNLNTRDRIAINAETIELFEDRDNAMILLSQELSYRKAFFSKFVEDCEEPQPKEDVCIVDEQGCLLASIKTTSPQRDSDNICLDGNKDTNDKMPILDSEKKDFGGADPKLAVEKGMKSESPTTFEKLDLIFYLVSPHLDCESKILLDIALEGSSLRASPFIQNINLCPNDLEDAIIDVSLDIYSDMKKHRSSEIVGSPYIGWIFGKYYGNQHYFPRVPGTVVSRNKCICGTSLRHLYQRKSYRRLRGIARCLDDLPQKRSQTVLGYNFVHTSTM